MLENELPFQQDDESLEESLDLQGFTYINKHGDEVELDVSQQDFLVQKIIKEFDRLDQQRAAKKRIWQEVERIVKGIVSEIDKDRFYALVPFGKQSVQTLVSHFWGRSLQTPKIFFNVEGLDDQSKEMAPIHRQNLLLHMEKDRVRQKMDKAIYLHALMKGVIIGHVGTCVKEQELNGPSGLVDNWQSGGFGEPQYDEAGQRIYKNITKTVFDGATFTVVDPYDFVFDTDNHENWDSCFKALRKHMIYEDIAADPDYSNYEELEELTAQKNQKNTHTTPLKTKKKKKDPAALTGVDESGRLEVIEFHGDIRLQDGTYLRNWTVVIAGRKKVIAFDECACKVNPFIKWEYEPSEDGWSIPPMAYILGIVDASSILLSSGVEGAKMAINPPMIGPEGSFQQKKHFITEGMFINYKPSTTAPNATPQPLQFKYDAPFPFLQLFEGQSEAVTGATRQLSGNITSNDKVQTATEFSGLQVVGNLILDRLVDLFNLDFKIPTIEKIAIINAVFNPEEKTIPIDDQDKGVREFKKVTPEVYFGNYEYKIEDNKSEQERKQSIQEKLSFFTQLTQDPVIGPRLKKIDLSKEMLIDLGYGNPGKYFMDDTEYVQWAATQAAITHEVELKSRMFLQQRMTQLGMLPDATAVTEAIGTLAGNQEPPTDTGMETI